MHSVIPRSELRKGLFEKYGLGKRLTGIKTILLNILITSIVTFSDAVIVHDTKMKQCLVRDYAAKDLRTFVVPHGITIASFLETEKAKSVLGLPNLKIVLYQGFITEGKGVEILIKAFKGVHEALPNTLLLIAGSFRSETSNYTNSVIQFRQ